MTDDEDLYDTTRRRAQDILRQGDDISEIVEYLVEILAEPGTSIAMEDVYLWLRLDAEVVDPYLYLLTGWVVRDKMQAIMTARRVSSMRDKICWTCGKPTRSHMTPAGFQCHECWSRPEGTTKDLSKTE